MRLKLFLPIAFLAVIFSIFTVRADETCAVCDKKILVTGDIQHGRGHESLPIQNAPRRQEESFRENIYGRNFSVSVPNLPAGKYIVMIGLAEIIYTNVDERLFDVSYNDEILATNLDVFAEAGGAGKVLVLKRDIDFPGDALRGPLTVNFIAKTNMAFLNTFGIYSASNISIISMRAVDLVDASNADALKIPVVKSPEIWRDTAKPVDARVKDLVSRLSLAEKVQEMRNGAAAIPRLGIPFYNYWNECLHGVARAGNATVFPQAIGMAATWDTKLIHDEADVIATEARAKHNDYISKNDGNSAIYYGLTFWTPNINVFRDPRWGRGQETYGEDPFLTSRIGVAFIKGLQGDDTNYIKAMACAKHFAVHSGPEPDRHEFNVSPSERDLFETYLPQFEAAAREGKVGAFMGSYNSVFGTPACASKLLLTDLLRNTWHFDGHVVSDCGAIYDIYANHKFAPTPEEAAADAVKAGDDLCCGTDYNSLMRAVQRGLISEKQINVAISRLLKSRFQLGLFDGEKCPYTKIGLDQNDTPEHEALALQVARESIVLLKNDSQTLPLDKSKIKKLLVVGANANVISVLLGNYNGTPSRPVTILDGIKNAVGANVQVIYEPGCPLAIHNDSTNDIDPAGWRSAVAAAFTADAVIYIGGISAQLEGEEMSRANGYDGFYGGDRMKIELPSQQTEMLKALQAAAIGKPVIFVNCSGSAMAMPWATENIPAILQAWYPGEQGGRAIADILFGDENPSGRLPVTFYKSTDDLPSFDDYSMSNRTYRYFDCQPEFAFGHGLSYTKFDYNDAKLSSAVVRSTAAVKVSFALANVGDRDGDEVAQVYFRHVNSAVPQPKLALCGFTRLHLQAGQGAHLTLQIPAERFRYWNEKKKSYQVEAGDYELLIGAASDDIRLRVPLTVIR